MRFTSAIFLSLLGILLLTGCGRPDNEKIKNSWWKYGSGYHIGDALRFDDNNLKGDTIYKNEKPVAVITYCGKGLFRNSFSLEIESIETGESGTYHDKGPR